MANLKDILNSYKKSGLAPLCLALVLFLGISPAKAQAWCFSLFFECEEPVVAGSKAAANAQTVPLLQSSSSPEPEARTVAEATIVEDTALLPESGPLGTLADIEDGEPTSDQISIYTVHKGDTLSGIAKMFGVSVNTIVWANDLKGPIAIGQNLVILPISGVRYTIKSGDTIQKIADKFKANADEIASFNGISLGEKLAVGEIVIIPDGEIVPLPAPKKPTVPATIKSRVYAVGGPLIPGYYLRPIVGGRKTTGIHGYNGVDLANAIGTPVMAAAEGTVIISKMGGYNGGYGNYVVISHPNGTQTLYAHLLITKVSAGEMVAQGEVIGQIGNTGRSTGAHLHFEVRGAANPF